MEEFIMASKLLRITFNRYIKACSAATEIYATLGNPGPDPRTLELLGCITRELQALASYEARIPNLKSTLAQYRNSARSIVPISALPPEILARVFELIRDSWACSISIKPNRRSIIKSSDFIFPMPLVDLSRVCTRWRQIAFGSPALWSHIHITTAHMQGPSFGRLVGLASRIGSPDTSLHIDVIPNVTPGILSNVIQLGRFYATTRQGLQKLRLDNWTDKKKFYSVLGLSLTNLAPDVLKQLILVDHSVERGGILLDDAQGKGIDPCLRPITVLHLIDVSIPGLSSAYSGLNDLRLIATGRYRGFSIGMAQLTTILSSSPRLRIFHFNYQVNRGGIISNSTTRIALEELEELNIRGMSGGHEYLLQLLSPGPKTMSLSISTDPNYDPIGNYAPISTSAINFLERSNVTELYVEYSVGSETFSPSSLLRGPLTRLRILGLRGFRLDEKINPKASGRSWSNRFDLLRLHDCVIHPEALQELASVCAIRTLNLCNCKLIEDNGAVAAHLKPWKNKLMEMVPYVVFTDPPEPSRVGEWEY